MEGIWDIFKKTVFWKFSNESTVQVNLVVHALVLRAKEELDGDLKNDIIH